MSRSPTHRPGPIKVNICILIGFTSFAIALQLLRGEKQRVLPRPRVLELLCLSLELQEIPRKLSKINLRGQL